MLVLREYRPFAKVLVGCGQAGEAGRFQSGNFLRNMAYPGGRGKIYGQIESEM